jgi:hypothetical protein
MANPPSFVPAISPEVPWHTAHHIRLLYQGFGNIQRALRSITPGTTTTNITQINQEGSSGGGGSSTTLLGLGGVNNQSGNTTYTTQNSDGGILLILNDASPVAVTLNAGVSIPWMIFATNLGAGLVTFTPSSGTINGGATFLLPFDYTTLIAFDGTNWWATELPAALNFADDETPSGTINGTNVTFTLAHSPNPAGSLELFLNGLQQNRGVDYTLSTNTITFTSAPVTSSTLLAWYRF